MVWLPSDRFPQIRDEPEKIGMPVSGSASEIERDRVEAPRKNLWNRSIFFKMLYIFEDAMETISMGFMNVWMV